MAYSYTPDLIPAERFTDRFEADIIKVLQDLSISDVMDEAELCQVLIYMNQNRPFTSNGKFASFKSDSLRRAQADVLQRLYSVWWADQLQKLMPEERQSLISPLRIALAVAKARDWNQPEPLTIIFSVPC